MDKVVSAFPLAIGTSLALETHLMPPDKPYDKSRKLPKPPKHITYYNSIFVCINTLIRNLLGATEGLDIVALRDEIIWEINYIGDMLVDRLPDTKVMMYLSEATRMYSNLTVTKRLRQKNSPKAKQSQDKERALSKMLKDTGKYEVYEDGIKGTGEKALVLTHLPNDLVEFRTFGRLDMLSSHTGNVKLQKDFYTIYLPVRKQEMSIFPFNIYLLHYLGDKNMVKGANLLGKDLLYKIASEKKWTSRTTIEKMKSNLRTKAPDVYIEMFRNN